MASWVALLGMNQMWKLRRISDKEDGSIVLNKIPISFGCSELDGEATWVTSMIVRTRLASYGRKSNRHRTLFSLSREDIREAEVVERISRTVITMGTAAFCMDNAFWDTFPIKVGQEVYQVKVLEK